MTVEGGIGARRGARWSRRSAPWVLLVGFVYLYLAVCATDDVTGVPAPAVSVAAPSSTDHHHGSADGFGVLIRHSDCFLLVVGGLAANALVLLALWWCADLSARPVRDHSPPGADRTRPPPPTAAGRDVLHALCVART